MRDTDSMQDQDYNSKIVQGQIAEAIRAKRERHSSTSIREELEAMEASLLADIESFDLDAMARQVQAESQQQNVVVPVAESSLVFPDILDDGAMPRVGIAAQPELKPETEAAPAPSPSSGGLLDILRRQAEACQHHNDARHHQLTQLETQADLALRQVFSYLHELVLQLNVIKPLVPRHYLVAGSHELQGLGWQQGFCDYRTRPESAGATMESISFNYRLVGKQGLVLDRDGAVAETFRQSLFDLNLNVKVEEFRNERRYLERARFTVAPEVKVNVRWEADLQQGVIVVLARNLDRLGSARYLLALENIDQALLDEFGRMLLGQPHKFFSYLRR